MPVFGAHFAHWFDLVIAIAWVMAGVIYYVSTSHNSKPVRAILRPLRLFGMWLSIIWSCWYMASFFHFVDPEGHGIVDGVTDGLVLTTAVFLMAVSTTASRMLRQLGVE